MNHAVQNKLARFLRTVVVEDKTSNLFLDELEIRLRMEFPHSLTNMHNPKTLAAFLGNVVRNAFPGITSDKLRKGPSVDRRQPVFYKSLRLVPSTEMIFHI